MRNVYAYHIFKALYDAVITVKPELADSQLETSFMTFKRGMYVADLFDRDTNTACMYRNARAYEPQSPRYQHHEFFKGQQRQYTSIQDVLRGDVIKFCEGHRLKLDRFFDIAGNYLRFSAIESSYEQVVADAEELKTALVENFGTQFEALKAADHTDMMAL